MDLSDVKKKLEDARRTSLTKHYKVSVAAVVDACLALVKVLEDQTKDQSMPSEAVEKRIVDKLKPLPEELKHSLTTSEEETDLRKTIEKHRGGPKTFGVIS